MAYAVSVTKDFRKPMTIGRGFGMQTGQVTITTYHRTGAEVTDVTGQFNTMNRVIVNGLIVDSGELFECIWDHTNKWFKLYNIILTAGLYTIEEAPNDVASIGPFHFIAIGTMKGAGGR